MPLERLEGALKWILCIIDPTQGVYINVFRGFLEYYEFLGESKNYLRFFKDVG